jgi:hypothetical protein
MNRSISFLRTSFISMPMLAGAVLATGCVDAAEPTTQAGENDLGTQAGEDDLVIQGGSSPVASLAEVRVEGGRTSLVSPGWTQTAPGIWASSSKTGVGSIVVGAEGHRVAIAKGETELAALRANGGSAEAIERQEAYLDNLKAGARLIATQPDVSLAVSCNVNFVYGPSSPIFVGFVGWFAGAQLSCTGGTQVFTIQAQACTNIGCGPWATFFPTVGATPLLYGTARAGSPGAACSGMTFASPPGVWFSASGACG